MNRSMLWIWGILTPLSYLGLYITYGNYDPLFFLFGLLMFWSSLVIGLIMLKSKKIEVSHSGVAVKLLLRKRWTFDLQDIEKWEEKYFIYSGQQTRKLILTLKNKKRLSITDKDDMIEYEKLYHYLRTHPQ